MSLRNLAAVLAGVLLAVPAHAQLDNPALADFAWFSSDFSFGPLGYRKEWSYEAVHEGGHPFISGGVVYRTTLFPTSIQSWAEVTAWIFEPDTVKRKSNKAVLGQKSNVAIRLRGYDLFTLGYFYFSFYAVPSCKAKAIPTTVDGKVAVSCKSGAWQELFLGPPTQAVMDHYAEWLGMKKIKFTVKLP